VLFCQLHIPVRVFHGSFVDVLRFSRGCKPRPQRLASRKPVRPRCEPARTGFEGAGRMASTPLPSITSPQTSTRTLPVSTHRSMTAVSRRVGSSGSLSFAGIP
jgi:hypothetical protein